MSTFQIIAVLCIVVFGALGGAAAAITTRSTLPNPEVRSDEPKPGPIQKFLWKWPVLGMSVLGIIGSLAGAFFASLVSDSQLSRVYSNVLSMPDCSMVNRLKSILLSEESDQIVVGQLMEYFPESNEFYTICSSPLENLFILIGISLVLGVAAQRLLAGLSEKLLEKVDRIQATQNQMRSDQLAFLIQAGEIDEKPNSKEKT